MLKESDMKSDKSVDGIWHEVLDSLSNKIDRVSFCSWISNLKFLQIQDDTVIISAPSKFIREWIINNYLDTLMSSIRSIDNTIRRIDIQVAPHSEKNTSKDNLNENTSKKYFHSTNNTNTKTVFSKLNPNFSFKNFICGESNRIAYKIFQDIADNNLSDHFSCKIFYLYSDVGMGKTHLLQSIANKVSKNTKSKLKVGYISAERFMHHYVSAIQNNDLLKFKEEIRSVDVFLLDDLQFICGKASTQKEFSSTVDALIELGKIVVVSCDRHPFKLETDSRTKSRLMSSNIINIKNAEFDLRFGILEHKNSIKNHILNQDLLKLIATKVKSSIRELEAALNNIITYCTVSDIQPDSYNVEKYLVEHLHFENKEPSFEQIIDVVTKHYSINKNDIISKNRSKQLVLAREVIANLTRQLTDLSLKEIGQKLGNRDHATVSYYIKNFKKRFNTNQLFAKEINNMKNFIYL